MHNLSSMFYRYCVNICRTIRLLKTKQNSHCIQFQTCSANTTAATCCIEHTCTPHKDRCSKHMWEIAIAAASIICLKLQGCVTFFAFQFKAYAEQQYPSDPDRQAVLVKQLQEQHYRQYMQQVYQQQMESQVIRIVVIFANF